jgi:hypothetical protein
MNSNILVVRRKQSKSDSNKPKNEVLEFKKNKNHLKHEILLCTLVGKCPIAKSIISLCFIPILMGGA